MTVTWLDLAEDPVTMEPVVEGAHPWETFGHDCNVMYDDRTGIAFTFFDTNVWIVERAEKDIGQYEPGDL